MHEERRQISAPSVGPPARVRRPGVVAIHLLLVALSYLLAFLLRFEFEIPPRFWSTFIKTLPALVAIRMFFFARYHLFSGLWRFVGMRDLVGMLKAIVTSEVVFAAGVLALFRYEFGQAFPRSVLILDPIFCLGLIAGVRVISRGLQEGRLRARVGVRRALIVGAGEAGELLIRSVAHNPILDYEIVGLVDDAPRLRGSRIHDIKVVGGIEDLPNLCRELDVNEILLAIPSAGGEERSRLLSRCRACGVPVKTVPTLGDLLAGAQINQLQEIQPEDLLQRQPVRVDQERLMREVRDRSILVTGAAGSIGSELCTQLAALGPARLVLLDRSESALYFTDIGLRDRWPDMPTIPIVADILDRRTLSEVFREHAPDVVYHAAAYKHVPLMEQHPLAAIENNVFGTEAVARAAMASGTRRFVLVSTDKAVDPVSVMGMTKRVAEDLLRSLGGGPTAFVAVRFGNVLGSAGSVLPLFRSQIARGLPITITDPAAERYFMLIAEAAQLVLQAGAMGKGGEIFFLDMGEPVKIVELAEDLIRLSGGDPGKDVRLETVGLRPGERLTEQLTRRSENFVDSEHERVLIVRTSELDSPNFTEDLESLRALVLERATEEALKVLGRMARSY